MGRPKKSPMQSTQADGQVSGPSSPSTAAAGEQETASTITIRLDENGRPLPLRAGTRERLERVLPDLGLGFSESGGVPPNAISPETAGRALDAVAHVQALLVCLSFHVPLDEAYRLLKLSEAEKKELSGPMQAVLSKSFGVWLAQHQDMAGLLAVWIPIEIERYERLNATLKKARKDAEAGKAETR